MCELWCNALQFGSWDQYGRRATGHQGSGEVKIVNERIYRGDDGSWYYRARGNDAVGPYDSLEAAEQALNRQVRSWSGRGKPRTIWSQHLPSSKLFRRSATRHP